MPRSHRQRTVISDIGKGTDQAEKVHAGSK